MRISKPVVRWVIGDCHDLGYEVLYESILNFKKIYKDKFIYCVCFNNKKIKNNLKKSLDLVDHIFDQKKFTKSVSYNPKLINGPHWKLYPPRLLHDQHEIIIDNDIVIYKEIEEINAFLLSNTFLITSPIKRSYSKQFGGKIKKNFNINSGLVGLPPGFDYKKEIENILSEGSGSWMEHFDEQTVVAAIMQNKKLTIIPFSTLSACCNGTKMLIGEKGTHFLGVNKGFKKWWREFKIKNL